MPLLSPATLTSQKPISSSSHPFSVSHSSRNLSCLSYFPLIKPQISPHTFSSVYCFPSSSAASEHLLNSSLVFLFLLFRSSFGISLLFISFLLYSFRSSLAFSVRSEYPTVTSLKKLFHRRFGSLRNCIHTVKHKKERRSLKHGDAFILLFARSTFPKEGFPGLPAGGARKKKVFRYSY